MSDAPPQNSPADARRHAPWPLWKKILAYAVMTALAAASVWVVDYRAVKYPQHPAQSAAP